MRARWMRGLAVPAAVLMIGGPVAADDFTGSEQEEQTLDCPAPGQGVPANQEPPGPGECDELEETTYQGIVWTNDVQCADGGQDAQVVKIYATGNPNDMKGGTGICNDGGTVPVQGRIAVYGSEEQEGFHAYADGDKDNSQEQAQGWARLDANTSGPSIRCAGEDGKRDATDPGPGDTQDNCG